MVAWSHSVAITGDLGGAMFRMNYKDVLGSFQLPGHISYFYWGEKAISAGTGRVYSLDATKVSEYVLLYHGDQLGDEADAVVEDIDMWMTPEEASAELALLPIPDIDIGEAMNAGQVLSIPFINQCDAIAWAAKTWWDNVSLAEDSE